MTELSPASLRSIRWTVTLAASLGWSFDAYVITIYALTVPLLAAEFHLATNILSGAIGSIFLFGYTIGTIGFGVSGDRFGRRVMLGVSVIETANHIQRRDAPRHGDFRDDSTFFTLDGEAYCLAGDGDKCFGRGRIFNRRTGQPEVDTAGGLRSDGRLIHICNVRRGPQHSPRLYDFDRDLQTVGSSLANIGHVGRVHTIAGCGRWVGAT